MPEIVIGVVARADWRAHDRLLDVLEGIETDASLSVVVADCDPDRQAMYETCVDRMLSGYRWPLVPLLVLDPAAAADAVVAHAMGDPEMGLLVMMDDVPSAGWLAQILTVQRETDADAVGGRGLFEDETIAAAERSRAGAYLVTRRALERLDRPHVEPGGEQAFFAELRQLGACFAWVEEPAARPLLRRTSTGVRTSMEGLRRRWSRRSSLWPDRPIDAAVAAGK